MPFRFDAYIFEKTGGIERANGFGNFGRINRLTDFDRQIGKNCTGFGALQTFNTDIPNHKGTKRFYLVMLLRRDFTRHRQC